MIGGLGVGIPGSDLQLEAVRQLEAQLTKRGPGRGWIRTLKPVFGERISRWNADQKIIVGHEIQVGAVRIKPKDPCQETFVRRDDVELLRPERLPYIVREVIDSD